MIFMPVVVSPACSFHRCTNLTALPLGSELSDSRSEEGRRFELAPVWRPRESKAAGGRTDHNQTLAHAEQRWVFLHVAFPISALSILVQCFLEWLANASRRVLVVFGNASSCTESWGTIDGIFMNDVDLHESYESNRVRWSAMPAAFGSKKGRPCHCPRPRPKPRRSWPCDHGKSYAALQVLCDRRWCFNEAWWSHVKPILYTIVWNCRFI